MARKMPSDSAKARAEAKKRRVPVDYEGMDPEMASTIRDERDRIAPYKPDRTRPDFSDVRGGSSSTARRRRRLRFPRLGGGGKRER